MSITTKVLLNQTRQKKDGTYPLIVRLTYHRKVINFPLGYTLSEKDWDAKHQRVKATTKITGNVTRLNNYIQKQRTKIFDKVTKLEDDGKMKGLSTKQIKEKVSGKRASEKITVFEFIEEVIGELYQAKQIGNAEVYRTLLKWITAQLPDKKLTFNQIDYNFLRRMEMEHYAKSNSAGGLSVYLRTLRAVYNRAIKAGIVDAANYPFKDYKIKSGTPSRKALSEEEFLAFKTVALDEGSPQDHARKMFMASFYLRGINWMDMALLRVNNIQGDFDRINYLRQKTKNKYLSIKISPKLRDIIESCLSENHEKEDFLFPILKKEDPEDRYHDIIKNKRKKLNKRLKEIAALCEIAPFTIYNARHTYAMALKRQGTPTNVIQDSLGHTTEEMTQNYLDSFENAVVDKADELLFG